VTAFLAVTASVQIALSTRKHLGSRGAIKNMAGFNRDFRFTQQKHICAVHKNECRADANTNNN